MDLSNKVVVYPVPPEIECASGYQVKVNGKVLPLLQAKVNFIRVPDMDLFPDTTAFGSFEMQDEVEIEIVCSHAVKTVDIRPKSYRIEPSLDQGVVRFKLSVPRKITIEFDSDLHKVIHLFANPVEVDKPDPNDPHVVYFGPGIHRPGVIELKNDQTIYLEGGAYVHGIVRGKGVRRSCVRGRGILSAETFPWPQGAFQVEDCEDLTLRDFILLDSAGWSVKINQCKDVLIENFKEICSRRNCDGIDLCSTVNAVIRDCFIRNWDDAICVKGLGKGISKHTRIQNCVIWSDAAQSIEIGYETQVDAIEDVVFKDIDILHHLMPGYLCLTVHNGDRAAISDVHFEDIRIEDSVAPLFDLWVGKAHWNVDGRRGSIAGIHFKNISLVGGDDPAVLSASKGSEGSSAEVSYLAARSSRLMGFDEEHGIRDVTFENVHVLGHAVDSLETGMFQINPFVKNVVFLPPSDGSPWIDLRAEPEIGVGSPAEVVFDASRSLGQDAGIIYYTWSFGDSHTASGPRVVHRYSQCGNYPVELKVTDSLGRTANLMQIYSVLDAEAPVQIGACRSGLRYTYYEGDFNFATDFSRLPPIFQGVIEGFNLPPKSRPGYHGMVYTGLFYAPSSGVYRFNVGMEFGCGYDVLAGGEIYLHDRLVSAHNSGWGRIGLVQGLHPVRFTLFRKTGKHDILFKVMGPDRLLQTITPTMVCHSDSD